LNEEPFRVKIKRKAVRTLERLPKEYRLRVLEVLDELKTDPLPYKDYDIKKLRGILDFFLDLYLFVLGFIAIISLSMCPFYYVGLFFSYYYYIMVIYLPIGPLPLGTLPLYFFPWFNSLLFDILRELYGLITFGLIIVSLGLFKFLLFLFARGKKIFVFELPKLMVSILILGFFNALMGPHYMENPVEAILFYTYCVLGSTLSIDITLLTYIYYREAIKNPQPHNRKNIIIIPTIWLALIWINPILDPRLIFSIQELTTNPIIAIRPIIWIIATILVIGTHITYYNKTKTAIPHHRQKREQVLN